MGGVKRPSEDAPSQETKRTRSMSQVSKMMLCSRFVVAIVYRTSIIILDSFGFTTLRSLIGLETRATYSTNQIQNVNH